MIGVDIDAVPFRAELKAITGKLFSFETQRVYLVAARSVALTVRGLAPKLSGVLRRAIVAQGVKPNIVATRGPSATAIVNLKRGKKGISRAPHGHLIEGGTVNIKGRFFFERGVQQSGERAMTKATEATEKIIKGALR